MDFAFGGTHSSDLAAYYQQVDRIRDCLEAELWPRGYGAGVTWLIMGVYCVDPTVANQPLWGGWETGTVIDKKYTKSKKLLELHFELNYGEVKSSAPESEQMVEILKRGVLATYGEVKAMGIKDFDVDAFYHDIGALFDERGWIKDPEKYRRPPSPYGQPADRVARLRNRGVGEVDDQMDFLLAALWTQSDAKLAFIDQVAPISDYLAIELCTKKYGRGVATVVMQVWCNSPGNEWLESHFDDYPKRYYDYGKVVFWDVKLEYAEVKSLGKEEFVEVLNRGIMGTAAGVKALGLKDFDADALYHDIGALLDERGWIKNPEKYKVRPSVSQGLFPGELEGARRIPKKLKMPEGDFWNLIQESIEASPGNVGGQIAFLEDQLAARDEKDIVGFELTLREILRRSYHHNVVALLKVIEGMVTDDPLLYFRCRLILCGRDLFYAAIQDPNKLTQRLDSDFAADDLLSVADRAFIRKLGKNTDEDLPSDVGATYVDYNFDSYPLLGRAWTDRSFAKRYAGLLRLYE